MKPTVLVIQHVAAEGPGLIGDALRSRGVAVEIVRVDRGDQVPLSLEATGLVVMGGPMGVYQADRYPHLRKEIQLIERAIRQDRPVLGICLGSQLLAAALGARVYPAGAKEIGWYDTSLLPSASEDALFRGVDARFPALHWHGDAFDLPNGAVPLAASELTPVQAFRAGRTAYGLLFHLEADRSQVEEMCDLFAGELMAEGIAAATLVGGAHGALPASRGVGNVVFGRWAKMVADEAALTRGRVRSKR